MNDFMNDLTVEDIEWPSLWESNDEDEDEDEYEDEDEDSLSS